MGDTNWAGYLANNLPTFNGYKYRSGYRINKIATVNAHNCRAGYPMDSVFCHPPINPSIDELTNVPSIQSTVGWVAECISQRVSRRMKESTGGRLQRPYQFLSFPIFKNFSAPTGIEVLPFLTFLRAVTSSLSRTHPSIDESPNKSVNRTTNH